MRQLVTWLAGALTVVMIAACGGGGSKTSASSAAPSATSRTATSRSTTSSSPQAVAATVTTGPVRAVLHGQNHAPTAGKPWRYVLTVHAADGRPLSGTVDVQFVLGSMVVGRDRPPVHKLRGGRLQESLTFPTAALGQPIALQTVVHTSAGRATLSWPVTVKK